MICQLCEKEISEFVCQKCFKRIGEACKSNPTRIFVDLFKNDILANHFGPLLWECHREAEEHCRPYNYQDIPLSEVLERIERFERIRKVLTNIYKELYDQKKFRYLHYLL